MNDDEHDEGKAIMGLLLIPSLILFYIISQSGIL